VKAVLDAASAAVALIAVYVALGGGRYEPTPPPDPCAPRAEQDAGGVTGAVERVGLTALGAAACDLGVSRERLLLSIAGEDELEVDAERRTDAFRAGLTEALDAEERAGRIGGTEAFLLRQAIRFAPIDELLERVFGRS
jgi:hypothetical protein